MTEIKNVDDKVLFSFDESKTTLAKVIGWYKNLSNAKLVGADLRGADLRGANLTGARLSYADLRGANLKGADIRVSHLFGADLRGANLEDANLEKAEVEHTNLSCANLKGADLKWACARRVDFENANLEGANLAGANLEKAFIAEANLSEAKLEGANLWGANLTGANLKGADLGSAELWGADLEDAKNVPELPIACPAEGSFVAWKKVGCRFLVKLEIPADAKRSSATTNKCRCDKALVLDIENLYNGEHPRRVINCNFHLCVYEVNKMVHPDSFDEDRWRECSNGIHFFMDKQDAIDY